MSCMAGWSALATLPTIDDTIETSAAVAPVIDMN